MNFGPLDLQDTAAGPSLVMYAGEPAAAPEVYSLGYEPNGHFWEAVARTVVALKAPELADRIAYAGDGDTFIANGSHEDLQTLAALLLGPVSDGELLTEVVEAASGAGVSIDD